MRIVILGSSAYSETTCAMAVRLAECGYAPVGALVLSTWQRRTLQRKLAQWGARDVARYARKKLIPHGGASRQEVHNRYLQPRLENETGIFRSLWQVADCYSFPVTVCKDQNALQSIAHLRQWSPDLIVFAGGNILRKPVLEIPRQGVLNVHLGLLPEIQGMSAPEWSLLTGVPIGVTFHYLDAGIDTGPVLQRFEFPDVARCDSLADLRNQLIAFGIERLPEVIAHLDRQTTLATEQTSRTTNRESDNQYFVMHEWLRARALELLPQSGMRAAAEFANG